MKAKLRRIYAAVMALAITISLVTVPVQAAEAPQFSDVDGHWGEEAIVRWADYGVIEGSNGQFNPDAPITRAEMAAVIARLLGLTETAPNTFTDVEADAWYAQAILRCAAAGIIQGSNGMANPNGTLTRQEAAVMLGRALGIQPDEGDVAFLDGEQVADWAAGYVSAMSDRGILNGVGGNQFAPLDDINRASVVTVLNNAIAAYANEPGATVQANGGITLVAADDVTVTGVATDILVAQGAAEGRVTVSGNATGTITVQAEGVTVALAAGADVGGVDVAEAAVGARIVVEEDASVGAVSAAAPESEIHVSGTVETVEAAATAGKAGITVSAGAAVGSITTAASETDITVSGTVETITVSETAGETTVTANRGAEITSVDNSAEDVIISGSGTVENVTTSGDNTAVNTDGTTLTVAEGVTGVTENNKDVDAGETVITRRPSAGGGSSSGGSSHSHSYPEIWTYTRNGDGIVTYTKTCVSGDSTITASNTEIAGINTVVVNDVESLRGALETTAVTAIQMTAGSYTLDSQICITRGVTLTGLGDGVTLAKSAGAWTDPNTGSKGDTSIVTVAGAVGTVTLNNLVLSGGRSIDDDYAHGLNVYKSDVVLNNITLSGNDGAGMVVAGSTVTAAGLHTSGNGWGGVNIDKVDGVSASLTFDAASTFDEDEGKADVYSDNGGVTVNAPAGWVSAEISGKTVWSSVFDGGSGTVDTPYEIATAEQLKAFRDSVNLGNSYNGKFIQLTSSIDLADEAWVPIGAASDTAFRGTFDGNSQTISNVVITDDDMENAGLFGVLNTPGTIKNLTVENVNVTAKSSVGALVGTAYTGTLESCTITGQINITAHYKVGGLTGGGYAKIIDCRVTAEDGSTVTGSYQEQEANLEGDNVGGLIGFMGEGNTILSGCTVSGLTVSGTRKVGGLAGSVYTDNRIENCKVSNVTVHSSADAGYASDNAASIGIGGLAGVFTANGAGNGHLTDCTVENITLTSAIDSDVHRGYLVGGMRDSLPDFPVAPWMQSGNKLQGTNSGSTSSIDETVVNGVYPTSVSTKEALTAVLANGGYVQLDADISADQELVFENDAVLDLNGKILTVNEGKSSVKIAPGKALTVTGTGTIRGALYADKNAVLTVQAGDVFQVESDSSMGWAVYGGTGATINITGGSYAATQEGNAIHVNSMFSGSLSMKNATVTVGSASVLDSNGIYANTPEIRLENVTVNAKYSRAFYCNSTSSHVTIVGGKYITDQVSGDPNPTLQYAGTLDISNASITRVGHGILYKVTWPKPDKVEGLTQSDLTFVTVDATVEGYQNTAFE